MDPLDINSSRPQESQPEDVEIISLEAETIPLLELTPTVGLSFPPTSSDQQLLIYNDSLTAPDTMSNHSVTIESSILSPIPLIVLDSSNPILLTSDDDNPNVLSHPLPTMLTSETVLVTPTVDTILPEASEITVTSPLFAQTPPTIVSSSPSQQNPPLSRIIRIIRKSTQKENPLLPPIEPLKVPKLTLGPDGKPLPIRIVRKPTNHPDPKVTISSNSTQSSNTDAKSVSVTSILSKTPAILPSSRKVVIFTPGSKKFLTPDETLPRVMEVSDDIDDTEEPRIAVQKVSENLENQQVSENETSAASTDLASTSDHRKSSNILSSPKEHPSFTTVAIEGDGRKESSGKCLALDCVVRNNPSTRICRRKLPINQATKAREWLISAGRSDLLPKLESHPESLRYATICELHFSDSQYMNPLRKHLIKGAVPTLFGKQALTLTSYAQKMKAGVEWSQQAAKQGQNLIYSLPTATRTKTLTRAPKSRQKASPGKNQLMTPKVLINSEPFKKMLKEIWEKGEFTDVILACKGWRRSIHKAVLAAASPYFKKLLSDPIFALVDEPSVIIMEERSPLELENLIKYIYEGQVSVPNAKIQEMKALFEELEIGKHVLPATCIDLPLRILQANVIEAPILPYESSSRRIYGYAAPNGNQTVHNALLTRLSNSESKFDFLEKSLLKDAKEEVKSEKLRKRLQPPICTILEKDSLEEEMDKNGLFDDVREVDFALPGFEIELNRETLTNDVELESESKSPFDLLREATEATTNPRLSTLLNEMYDIRYVSPYLRSLSRKGYPSPKLPDKSTVLSTNPIPKKEQRNFTRAQRQAARRAKIREQRKLEEANKAAARRKARSTQIDRKQSLRKVKKTPQLHAVVINSNHDYALNVSNELPESDNSIAAEMQPDATPVAKKSTEETRGYVCEYCGKAIKSKTSFRIHRNIHLGIYAHKCDLCGKQFRTKRHLKIHTDMHNGVRSHRCEVCGAFFLTSEQLRVHKRVHTGEKPYKCNFCEKKFRVRGGVLSHMRTHTKEKPFACTICKMNFTSFKTVNEHKANHTQENCELRDPSFFYHCSNCRYYYCRPAHVKQHMCESAGQSETGSYVCAQCDKHFESEEYAQSHVFHIHENPIVPVNLTCQTCMASFQSAYELFRHARSVHIARSRNAYQPGAQVLTNGNYKCSHCKQEFEEEEAWEEHKRSHVPQLQALTCPTCGKTFKFKKTLNQHQLGHLEVKPFACSQCDKSYVTKLLLENHVNRVHLNVKPYRCDTCGACFAGYGNFSRHKYRHTDARRCKICGRVFDSKKGLIEHEQLHETGQLSNKSRSRMMRPKSRSSRPTEDEVGTEVAAPPSQVEVFQHVIEEDAFGANAAENEEFNESSFYVVLDASHLA